MEVDCLRQRLANVLTLAVWATPTASQEAKDKEQKSADSSDCSWSDQTQLIGWIIQLGTIIRHEPGSFPVQYSNMQYPFNHLRVVVVDLLLPHIWDDETIWLGDQPAVGDPVSVVIVE